MSYIIGPQPTEQFDYFRPVEARFRAGEAISRAASSAASSVVSIHDAKVNSIVSKYSGEYKVLVSNWMKQNEETAGTDFEKNMSTFSETVRNKHIDAIPNEVARSRYALAIQDFHSTQHTKAIGLTKRAEAVVQVDEMETNRNNAFMVISNSTGTEVSTMIDARTQLMEDIQFRLDNGAISQENYVKAKRRVNELAYETADLLLNVRGDPQTALDVASTYRYWMTPDQYMKITVSANDALEKKSPLDIKQRREQIQDTIKSFRHTGATDEDANRLADAYLATFDEADPDVRANVRNDVLDQINTHRKIYVMEGALLGKSLSDLTGTKKMLENQFRSGQVSEFGYKEMSKFLLDRIHLLQTDEAAYADEVPLVQAHKNAANASLPVAIRQGLVSDPNFMESDEFKQMVATYQGNIFQGRHDVLTGLGKTDDNIRLLTNMEETTFLATFNSATTDQQVNMVGAMFREAGKFGPQIARQLLQKNNNPVLRLAIDSTDFVVTDDGSVPHIPKEQQRILGIIRSPVAENPQSTYNEAEKAVVGSDIYGQMVQALLDEGQSAEYNQMIEDYKVAASKAAMFYMAQGTDRKKAIEYALTNTISANFGFIETEKGTVLVSRRTRTSNMAIDQRTDERLSTIGKAVDTIDVPVDIVSRLDILGEKDARVAREYGESKEVTDAIDSELSDLIKTAKWTRTFSNTGEEELTLFYSNDRGISESKVNGVNEKPISIPIDVFERIVIEADAVSEVDVTVRTLGGPVGVPAGAFSAIGLTGSAALTRQAQRTVAVPDRGQITREEYINMRVLEYLGIEYEKPVPERINVPEMGRGLTTGM